MTLVTKGYFANITLVDSSAENKATLRYQMTSADFTALLTDVATLISALNAITDAVIVSYSIGELYGEDATFAAAEGVQIENVASISTRLDALQEKWATVRVPAPNIGIFVAATGTNSNVVDVADAALLTYLNLFKTTTGIAEISDGETILAPGIGNTKGKRIHRGSRKG